MIDRKEILLLSVEDAEFICVWCLSKTIGDVTQAVGKTPLAVVGCASKLRSRGFHLRPLYNKPIGRPSGPVTIESIKERMPAKIRNKVNWELLRALATKLSNGNEEAG